MKSNKYILGTFVVIILLTTGLVLYRDFVFGNSTLLYRDIGVDSLDIFYPYLVHVSDYIRENGYPSWSFYVGMGQSLSLFAGYLLYQPVVWLHRDLIAGALVYQHLLKVILVGMLFFAFLRQRRTSEQAALAGSLLLSFSAYMCMGSCWYGLSDEVLTYTFILFAVEMALQARQFIYLPLATAFAALFTPFQLYLAALLLTVYVPARLIQLSDWRDVAFRRTLAQMAGLSVLGVGLAAFVLLDATDAMIHSPRGLGGLSVAPSLFFQRIWRTAPHLQWVTTLLRPFGNDILGSGTDFRGWKNYLEAPLTYCGVLSLLLFPQAFASSTCGQRVRYSLIVCFILIPSIFPWFRHLFWLFQGEYYRTYSLFAVLGVLAISMSALSRYTEQGSLHLPILALTAVMLLIVVFWPAFQSYVDPTVRNAVALLIILYSGILTFGKIFNQFRVTTWLVVLVVVIELLYLDSFTLTRRVLLTKSDFKEKRYYNDHTVDAVQELKSRDNGWYRITKTWASIPFHSLDANSATAYYNSGNDAMVFGYYGTPSYSSVNNLNYIEFLRVAGAIQSGSIEVLTRWAKGCQNSPLLQTFAGEKYVLTKNPVPFQALAGFRYTIINRFEDVYVLENGLALPFGLAYTEYLPEQAFLDLPISMRPVSLFCAVVLPRNEANKCGLPPLEPNGIEQAMKSGETLVERRAMSLQLTSFRQTEIKGNISLSKRAVLVCQTPFDPGWHAFLDGKSTAVLNVDEGLLGVLVERGEHKLTLHFVARWLHFGLGLSMVSLFLLVVLFWPWPVRKSGAWQLLGICARRGSNPQPLASEANALSS